jgi:aminoglycoside phosphotransferase (APT) family kinase protein
VTTVPAGALDVAALRRWMTGNAGADGSAALDVELAPGGRSNLTFFVSQGERQWVLRRPPLGPVLPSAHDMRREVKVLRALRDTEVPVPRVQAFCPEDGVIGAPFYLMDRVPGTVVRGAADILGLGRPELAELADQLVQVLARIHSVDWRAVGLADHGRSAGFLERQLARWTQQWQRSTTRELPEMDLLLSRLAATMPQARPPTLVHGDFRLDNVLFALHPTPAPTAVLDWELSTIGDPLTDVGLLMVYWPDPSDPLPPPSVAPQLGSGTPLPSRAELAARYCEATGLDLSHLGFYVMFGFFKLAVILEGLHRRYASGRAVGDGFDRVGAEVPQLVDRALAVDADGLAGLPHRTIRGSA